MDADEQDICNYLKSWPRQFISIREICKRASGKLRYRDDPYWAYQVVSRLVEKGFLETDNSNHYRLKPEEKKGRPKKWISPEIQKILEESGKEFGGTVSLEDESKDETP